MWIRIKWKGATCTETACYIIPFDLIQFYTDPFSINRSDCSFDDVLCGDLLNPPLIKACGATSGERTRMKKTPRRQEEKLCCKFGLWEHELTYLENRKWFLRSAKSKGLSGPPPPPSTLPASIIQVGVASAGVWQHEYWDMNLIKLFRFNLTVCRCAREVTPTIPNSISSREMTRSVLDLWSHFCTPVLRSNAVWAFRLRQISFETNLRNLTKRI